MPRLPMPGKDNGTWGDILNEYLSHAHNPDGSLKDGVATTDVIKNGVVTEALLDPAVRAKLNAPSGDVVSDATPQLGGAWTSTGTEWATRLRLT